MLNLRDVGLCPEILQLTQRASTGESDSDDEPVPDKEIPPAFSNEELGTLNTYYRSLWRSFQEVRMMKFGNAWVKFFFVEFGTFLLMVHHQTARGEQYRSLVSTNPSGIQPGALALLDDDDECPKLQKRVADYTMYDYHNKMYCIVGEIKSGMGESTNQNIEQMVGLFRKKQYAMLGFSCNQSSIHPRVLIQHESVLSLCLGFVR